jgi:hypothetical protein
VTSFSNYRLPLRLKLASRRTGGRVLSRLGVKHPWVLSRPNPLSARPLSTFRLFALIGTWMEADIIEATVKNAFTQGCDRVFLVDNESPDDTVARAVAAGAEFAGSVSTDTWNDDLRYVAMNDLVARLSDDDGSDHIWWLWLDADEFPHGPHGLTIREYLSTLDQSFRIVGGRLFNHYPTAGTDYVSGRHPLDFQPLCEELQGLGCWSCHNNHPLQRFDRDRPFIAARGGKHAATSAERPLLEPAEALYVHHFPFRQERVTRRRLTALLSERPGAGKPATAHAHGGGHARARRHKLDAVYANDWEAVGLYAAPEWGWKRPQLIPVPWDTLVPSAEAHVARWYSPSEPLAATGG